MRSPSRLLLSLPLLLLSNLASGSTEVRGFPLIPSGEPGALGAVELLPVLEELAELRAAGATLTLTGAPLPGGPVDLELRRLPIDAATRVYVDGEERPGPADHGDLSVWRGQVRGRAGSDVLLGFSGHGCHGWIHDGDTRWNLLSSSGAGGDWSAFTSRLVPEEAIAAIGPESGPVCATDTSGARKLVAKLLLNRSGRNGRNSNPRLYVTASSTSVISSYLS